MKNRNTTAKECEKITENREILLMTTKQILVFLSVTLEHVSFVSKAEERNMIHSCLHTKKALATNLQSENHSDIDFPTVLFWLLVGSFNNICFFSQKTFWLVTA